MTVQAETLSPPAETRHYPLLSGAFLILLLLALYVAWVWRRPRVVGREDWCVTLPGGPHR